MDRDKELNDIYDEAGKLEKEEYDRRAADLWDRGFNALIESDSGEVGQLYKKLKSGDIDSAEQTILIAEQARESVNERMGRAQEETRSDNQARTNKIRADLVTEKYAAGKVDRATFEKIMKEAGRL